MLFPATVLPGIAGGDVTIAFRAWKRPTVKSGGTLITPIGQLAIDSVEVIDPASITDRDAQRAGAADADAVRSSLRAGDDRTLYRVAFRLLGDDPRLARRANTELTEAQWHELNARLDGMDRRSPTGPWTDAVLHLIHERPAVVSTELAHAVGLPRLDFKTRVRRLKALGLTESLDVGYCLSPLGKALLARRQCRPESRCPSGRLRP